MRKNLIRSLLCITVSLSMTGCSLTGGSDRTASGNYLFAIDDEKFDYSEAKIIFMTYQCMNESVYSEVLGTEFWDQKVSDDLTFEDYIKEYCVLPELVCVKALCLMGEDQGITISKDEKQLIEIAAKQYYANLNLEEKKYLNAEYDTCYQAFSDYYMAHKVMDACSADVDTEISDDEARVTVVKEIYLTDAEKAEAAYKALTEDGTDFATVYEEYNQSRDTDMEIGDDGTVAIERGMESDTVQEAIFNLYDGQYSDILTTEDGNYLIVLCVDALDEAATEQHKQEIADRLVYEAWYEDYETFMEDKTTTLNETAYDLLTFEVNPDITNDTFFEIFNGYIEDRADQ